MSTLKKKLRKGKLQSSPMGERTSRLALVVRQEEQAASVRDRNAAPATATGRMIVRNYEKIPPSLTEDATRTLHRMTKFVAGPKVILSVQKAVVTVVFVAVTFAASAVAKDEPGHRYGNRAPSVQMVDLNDLHGVPQQEHTIVAHALNGVGPNGAFSIPEGAAFFFEGEVVNQGGRMVLEEGTKKFVFTPEGESAQVKPMESPSKDDPVENLANKYAILAAACIGAVLVWRGWEHYQYRELRARLGYALAKQGDSSLAVKFFGHDWDKKA